MFDNKLLFAALAALVIVSLGGCGNSDMVENQKADSHPVSAAIANTNHDDDASTAFDRYMAAASASERRKWICLAVNNGLPRAQSELARLHWPRPGAEHSPFLRDMEQAFAWSLIATRNGEHMNHMLDRLGSVMSPDQQWEATKLAAFWKPDPENCIEVETTGCLKSDHHAH